jgi:hypothetical protein
MLLIATLKLSMSLKQALNSMINSLKLFNIGEFASNDGAKHKNIVPVNKVPLK